VAADAHSTIFVRDLRTGKLDQLKGTEGALFPFWSPDGRAIGFFAGEKLRTVSLDQGTVQAVCDAPNGRGGTWNADGQIVFTPNIGDALYVVSDFGGSPRAVTPPTQGARSDRVPFFLPDQKHFLLLYGAAQAATQAQQKEKAGIYYTQLLKNCEGIQSDRPELAEAKTLLVSAGGM
jgi:Tol biopolymer transport system component